MTEYIEQGSASDRYEAARALLADWDKAATPDALGLHDAGGFAMRTNVTIRETLRALITPPGVGESDEAIAERVAHGYLSEHGMPAVMQLAALAGHIERIALACVRAGIQSAHETWEPEVALRPSQEQMLRWLGLDYFDSENDEGELSVFIRPQHIDREEI